MAEGETEKSVSEKTESDNRSPLLMPVMEGNSLQSGDVADFLKTRLLREANKPVPPVPLRLS
jgi:hypothetical protein